ncbi:basic proline-rich protein-like [Pezoporus occidentalis]|uniref:basic proline-rich protein-like n=1 Tax=Pezoporus occidentalis TaxID=407982 RepID=UPI002F909FFF
MIEGSPQQELNRASSLKMHLQPRSEGKVIKAAFPALPRVKSEHERRKRALGHGSYRQEQRHVQSHGEHTASAARGGRNTAEIPTPPPCPARCHLRARRIATPHGTSHDSPAPLTAAQARVVCPVPSHTHTHTHTPPQPSSHRPPRANFSLGRAGSAVGRRPGAPAGSERRERPRQPTGIASDAATNPSRPRCAAPRGESAHTPPHTHPAAHRPEPAPAPRNFPGPEARPPPRRLCPAEPPGLAPREDPRRRSRGTGLGWARAGLGLTPPGPGKLTAAARAQPPPAPEGARPGPAPPAAEAASPRGAAAGSPPGAPEPSPAGEEKSSRPPPLLRRGGTCSRPPEPRRAQGPRRRRGLLRAGVRGRVGTHRGSLPCRGAAAGPGSGEIQRRERCRGARVPGSTLLRQRRLLLRLSGCGMGMRRRRRRRPPSPQGVAIRRGPGGRRAEAGAAEGGGERAGAGAAAGGDGEGGRRRSPPPRSPRKPLAPPASFLLPRPKPIAARRSAARSAAAANRERSCSPPPANHRACPRYRGRAGGGGAPPNPRPARAPPREARPVPARQRRPGRSPAAPEPPRHPGAGTGRPLPGHRRPARAGAASPRGSRRGPRNRVLVPGGSGAVQPRARPPERLNPKHHPAVPPSIRPRPHDFQASPASNPLKSPALTIVPPSILPLSPAAPSVPGDLSSPPGLCVAQPCSVQP